MGGGEAGSAPPVGPGAPGQVRVAGTRELIAALAATEDALRDPGCDPVRRRELAEAQARLVRELRLRKSRWRGR